MYGNCLTFAIPDFLKHGGSLYLEIWKHHLVPHFTVQRGSQVFDFGNGKSKKCGEFWFDGERRTYDLERYSRLPCRRVLLATRKERPR